MALIRRTLTALTAAGMAAAAVAAAPAASAESEESHSSMSVSESDRHYPRSLAAVLAADGQTYDRNSSDFDIVDGAVRAVLEAKPYSPVAVLADGSTPVTAFLPTDGAFRALVKDLTGKTVIKETNVLAAVASLGTDTVETVLLYHVVPGATITSEQALMADGVALTTAQGGTFTVDVVDRYRAKVKLIDQDYNDRNPRLIPDALDINEGNPQIAHGIDGVLRPANL
ncbi:MAG: fasciclin domain-containing protein [Angustibacter sp.]